MAVPYYAKFGQPILSPSGDEIWGFWTVNKELPGTRTQFVTESGLLGLPTFSDNENADKSPSLTERFYVYIDFDGNWRVSDNCTQRDLSECPWFITSPLTGDDSIYQAALTLNNCKEFRSFMGLNSPSEVVFKRIFQDKWRSFLEKKDHDRRYIKPK